MKRRLKKIVTENTAALENSDKSLKAIYNIMFDFGDTCFAETSDGYRIKKTTYKETRLLSERYASAIYSKVGAQNEFIGIEAENGVEWIASFWAILRSGNRPLLVNCRHPEKLSNRIISDLGVRYVISDKTGLLNAEYITFAELGDAADAACSDKSGAVFPAVPEDVFANELALSTSATSMNETVCFFTGAELSAQILNTSSILKKCPQMSACCKGEIKQLAFLPFYHIFGLVAVYFWFAFFGRTFVFLRDYSSDTILATCRRHGVTHIFAVPMLWHTIEKQLTKELGKRSDKEQKKFRRAAKFCTGIQNVFPRFGGYVARRMMRSVTDRLFGDSVRFLISGGSSLRSSALELINSIGYPLHNGYGMSEIGIASVELSGKPSYMNLNSVGRPFDSVKYRLSEDGSLLVSGDSLCRRTMVNGVEHETPEWFDTGDIAELKNGRWYIRGRKSDTVIGENGENINPDDTEQCFSLPSAEAFSVLGLDTGNGEELCLVVKIGKYLSPAKTEETAKKAYSDNNALPLTAAVKRFYFTYDDIAPAAAVKVGRKYLSRGIAEGKIHLLPFGEVLGAVKGAPDGAVSPALIEEVRRTVAKELGVEPDAVGINDHIILDLGATSLQYFSILSALAEQFKITGVSEKESYRYTAEELARYIEGRM